MTRYGSNHRFTEREIELMPRGELIIESLREIFTAEIGLEYMREIDKLCHELHKTERYMEDAEEKCGALAEALRTVLDVADKQAETIADIEEALTEGRSLDVVLDLLANLQRVDTHDLKHILKVNKL